MKRTIRAWLCVAATLSCIQSAAAKKVICVSSEGDPVFLSAKEGWERSQMAPGDVISIGGALKDCLEAVENGDQLVIVAHGWDNGRGFRYGGADPYTGFGSGPNQGGNPAPVPADWGSLTGVSVTLCMCWGGRDPDEGGPALPLTAKILLAMNGTQPGSNQATGPQTRINGNANWNLLAPNEDAASAAENCLRNNNSWASKPPANRPGATDNQQTAAQAIVDACPGAQNVTVQIKYGPATPGAPESADGAGPPLILGCECPLTPPGCGFGVYAFEYQILGALPTLSAVGVALLGLGLVSGGVLLVKRHRPNMPE